MSVTAEELAEKAEDLARAFSARRTFEEARAALNEAGMLRARHRVDDTLDAIPVAQAKVRGAAEGVAQQRANFEQVLLEAEWELDSRFVVEGNKTFLVDGDDRRQMTADERKTWKQAEARKHKSVRISADALRAAEQNLAEAKDALSFAELAFRAARADLDAAISTVGVLAASIRKENN